jgi:excisionase family DNA binding protein
MKPAAVATARLMNDREGAAYLGLSRSQFRALVAAGKIPRVRVPAEDGRDLRRLLVDRTDLDKLIEQWKR